MVDEEGEDLNDLDDNVSLAKNTHIYTYTRTRRVTSTQSDLVHCDVLSPCPGPNLFCVDVCMLSSVVVPLAPVTNTSGRALPSLVLD